MTSSNGKPREKLDNLVQNSDIIRDTTHSTAHLLHNQLETDMGKNRDIMDFLHGKPFGHPLHPILTDIPIGSWILAAFFDVLALVVGSKGARQIADVLTTVGTLAAIPTAISGIADYSSIKKSAAPYAATHGILNTIALYAYVRSTIARVQGQRFTALFYSLIGLTVSTVSAWFGGDMVYRHRIGVNHAVPEAIDEWTTVMAAEDLEDENPTRVDADGVPVLLFRYNGIIHATHAVCSHAGGPLEKGRIVDETCIVCPWHDSVYDMRDGRLIHSPSTFSQPRYQVRVNMGEIQVRNWYADSEG